MHILYKHEIDQIPVLARAFRMGGFIPIDRRNKESAHAVDRERAPRRFAPGNSFLIFPEGTRSRTDEMLPFKKGGFVMAIKAGAPIVPVAISGGRAAMQRGSAIIRPVTDQHPRRAGRSKPPASTSTTATSSSSAYAHGIASAARRGTRRVDWSSGHLVIWSSIGNCMADLLS